MIPLLLFCLLSQAQEPNPEITQDSQVDSAFRHELVAYWLGLKTSDMPWKPEETLNVVWTTKIAYQREVGAFVEADRAKMSATLMMLKEQKLLNENEIDRTFPQILMQFECYINPCPLPGIATRR